MHLLPLANHLIPPGPDGTPLAIPLALWRAPAFLPEGLLIDQYAWWIVGIGLAATLWVVGRQRNEIRLARAGQVLLGVTLAWVALAKLLDTQAERLYNAHLSLIAAAEKGDVEAILRHFDPNFAANDLMIPASATQGERRTVLRAILSNVTIRDVHITAFKQTIMDNVGESQLTALVESTPSAGITKWHLGWKDDPTEGWRMHSATLVEPKIPPGLLR